MFGRTERSFTSKLNCLFNKKQGGNAQKRTSEYSQVAFHKAIQNLETDVSHPKSWKGQLLTNSVCFLSNYDIKYATPLTSKGTNSQSTTASAVAN
jgi:hypothetical protein